MKNIYGTQATVDNLPRTVADIKYVNVMQQQYFFFQFIECDTSDLLIDCFI
jgi:hypothetical protein